MDRVIRYSLEADRCARLAEAEAGVLGDAYRTLETSYRVLAASVRIELWWPRQPPAVAGETAARDGAA